MKMLVLESDRGRARPLTDQLGAAGHEVVRCDSASGVEAVACTGLEVGGNCPIEGGDVDVAVVTRGDDAGLSMSEHGALCARRARIPLVVVGEMSRQPFGADVWTAGSSASAAEIEATCAVAARNGAAHAAAVRRDLLRLGLLDRDHQGEVGIEVERSSRRLELTLRLHPDLPRRAAIVKTAAEALRRYDRTAAVIDVRVED